MSAAALSSRCGAFQRSITPLQYRRLGRAGLRVSALWNEAEVLVLLTLYAKSKTDNLTGAVLKEIRRALED
jgi:hypothetical protein